MCKVNLSRWRLLRFLLERVKYNDCVSLAHIIENPHRRPFSPYTQFVNSGRNNWHRTTERHPKTNSFLKISKRFSDMTADQRFLCSNKLQCPRMKIDRFHDVIVSQFRDIDKEIVRPFYWSLKKAACLLKRFWERSLLPLGWLLDRPSVKSKNHA